MSHYYGHCYKVLAKLSALIGSTNDDATKALSLSFRGIFSAFPFTQSERGMGGKVEPTLK